MAHRPAPGLVPDFDDAAAFCRRRIDSKCSSTTPDGMPRRFQLLTRWADPRSRSMPNSLAKALSPPAALMIEAESIFSMDAEHTQAVYGKSNNLCMPTLNETFRVAAVALTWSTVVEFARVNRKESEEEFRAVLMERGVSTATITNWKGGRPIPVARYPLLSDLLGVSTDELHGKKPPAGRKSTLIVPNSDDEAKILAADICQLKPEQRDIMTAMVHMFVAQNIRGARAEKANKASQPKSKGKSPTRPDA